MFCASRNQSLCSRPVGAQNLAARRAGFSSVRLVGILAAVFLLATTLAVVLLSGTSNRNEPAATTSNPGQQGLRTANTPASSAAGTPKSTDVARREPATDADTAAAEEDRARQIAEATRPPSERDRPVLLDDPAEGINLLRLPKARLELPAMSSDSQAELKELFDGDLATTGSAAAAGQASVDLVFGFDGQTVTPHRLVVLLPRRPPAGAAIARIEILVSSLSPHAGFRSVRSDPIRAEARVQEFAFQPAGARWIMLRLTPAETASSVALAELAVLGRDGPPTSLYAFKESPAKALDVLARLKAISGLDPGITSDEASLFEDAQDGRLDQWSLAEAALLASGIGEAGRRQEYLKRLESLEADSRKALDGLPTIEQKGDRLLKWLHEQHMAKGYVSGQTDLSRILDTGTFNCVSSATLYNVLGRRLGLDVRAIEVPDHAFSIVYDGVQHADVETTTPEGFNPARDPAVVDALRKKTSFLYIPDSHRDRRREITDVGLAAVIYYNHGVELTHAGRHHEALLTYFRALSLDPEFASAVKNALVVLSMWGADLARKAEFEPALAVLAAGLDLAPQDAALLHNRNVVFAEWAQHALRHKRDDEALAILKRAAGEVPSEAARFREMQALIFIWPGEEHVTRREWNTALELAARGLAKLEGEPQTQLRHWRSDVFRRWAQSELDDGRANEGRADEALKIAERALQADPQDAGTARLVAGIVQESALRVLADQGPEAARMRLTALLKRFETVAEVQRAGSAYVQAAVRQLCDKSQFDQALAFIEQHADLLSGAEHARQLKLATWDAKAEQFVKKGDWESAFSVYEQALKESPEDAGLKHRLGSLLLERIEDALTREGEAKAREVFKKHAGWLRTAGVDSIDEFLRIAVAKLSEAGNHSEAIALLVQHQSAFSDRKEWHEELTGLYDDWSRQLAASGDWEAALAVYEVGLQRAPDDRLSNNFIATVQDGAWELYEKQGEEAARRFLAFVLRRYPGREGVLDRVHYHIQSVAGKVAKDKTFEEAEAAIARHAWLLAEPAQCLDHYRRLYDRWADHVKKTKNHEAAVEIYRRGLSRVGDDEHLRHNAIVLFDHWAKTFFKKDWAEAIRVYRKGLEVFKDASLLKDNLAYCQEQAKKK